MFRMNNFTLFLQPEGHDWIPQYPNLWGVPSSCRLFRGFSNILAPLKIFARLEPMNPKKCLHSEAMYFFKLQGSQWCTVQWLYDHLLDWALPWTHLPGQRAGKRLGCSETDEKKNLRNPGKNPIHRCWINRGARVHILTVLWFAGIEIEEPRKSIVQHLWDWLHNDKISRAFCSGWQASLYMPFGSQGGKSMDCPRQLPKNRPKFLHL